MKEKTALLLITILTLATTASAQPIWVKLTGGPVRCVAWSPDGKLLAAATGPTIAVYTKDGKQLWNHTTRGPVWCVAWSPDGARLAAGSRGGIVYVFDQSGELLWSYQTSYWVESVAWSPDGARLAAGSGGGIVYVFYTNGMLLWSYETGGLVRSVAWSRVGGKLAIASIYLAVISMPLLRVSCEPSCEVYVDGFRLGETPLEERLAPGSYTVTLRHGMAEWNTTISLEPGEMAELNMSWSLLKVSCAPSCDVYVNGSRLGEAPLGEYLAPSVHIVTLRYRGAEWSTTVSLEPGGIKVLDVSWPLLRVSCWPSCDVYVDGFWLESAPAAVYVSPGVRAVRACLFFLCRERSVSVGLGEELSVSFYFPEVFGLVFLPLAGIAVHVYRGRRAKVERYRAYLARLEELYGEGRVSKPVYERLKKEYEEKLKGG